MIPFHKILNSLRDALTYTLFFFSCFFPRDKSTWAFIGWHTGDSMEIFADNTKYLFLHIAHNYPEITPIWIAKDKKLAELLRSNGYSSYYQYSFHGILSALRAGYTVIDAYMQPENFRWSGRSTLIQLLHGRGMKKRGYGDAQLRIQNYIFCTSPFTEALVAPIFKKGAQIFHTGYPRNDVLFRSVEGSIISTDDIARGDLSRSGEAKKKALLYAPTFRRGEKIFGLASKFDLNAIDAWLTTINAHLYISLHPKYRAQARERNYPNIFFVEESEIYPLLASFDLLIADYSSLIYDFLLLDRPVVFFPYDLEEYSEGEGLAFSYDDYTPGPKAYTTETLMTTVKEILLRDSFGEERKRVRDLYHTHQDGGASERIMKILRP